MATSNSVQPTRLSCKKGDFESEMWVQVDGKPVEVYGATVGADGTPEAWIVSEVGKCYEVCSTTWCDRESLSRWVYSYLNYADLRVSCKIDNVDIKGVTMSGTNMCDGGSHVRIADQRISQTRVQKLRFSKPVLTEQATPGLQVEKLAIIELKFDRCRKAWSAPRATRTKSERSATMVNERSKTAALMDCVTDFTEPESRRKSGRGTYVNTHPQDKRNGYYNMRLRYASKDLLQALGHVPLGINIKPGEAGLKEDRPIDLEAEESQAGPSRNGAVEQDIKPEIAVKAESSLPAGDTVTQIADEIAEAQRVIDELKSLKRAAEAGQDLRQTSNDNDVDNKENVVQDANKRPKIADPEPSEFFVKPEPMYDF